MPGILTNHCGWDGGSSYIAVGGRERSEEAEPVCEISEFGRKAGTGEAVLFACFRFLRGKVLRMFVCGGK